MEFISNNWEWLTGVIGGIVTAVIAYLKALVIKVNKLCLHYEQIDDAKLLSDMKDYLNSEGKNKVGHSTHKIANRLRRRLVITGVRKSVLIAPKWLINIYIRAFCDLNKMPKIEEVQEKKE